MWLHEGTFLREVHVMLPLIWLDTLLTIHLKQPVSLTNMMHVNATYTRVMGSLSNSSPIFMVAESAWITSTGSWSTWVKARNCRRRERGRGGGAGGGGPGKRKWLKSTKSDSTVHQWQTSTTHFKLSAPSCRVLHVTAVFVKLIWKPTHTHTQQHDYYACTLCNASYNRLCRVNALPVVYMSPVFGLVRKGRKSSALPLMRSAVLDRSSSTLVIDPGWNKTAYMFSVYELVLTWHM